MGFEGRSSCPVYKVRWAGIFAGRYIEIGGLGIFPDCSSGEFWWWLDHQRTDLRAFSSAVETSDADLEPLDVGFDR